MADPPDTKIRLTSEDKTAPVIKKMGDNFRALGKDIQKSFKEAADGALLSIDQIERRQSQQSALSGKERIKRAEETSRALHGIIQKDISEQNTYARALNEQNIEAAKAGKVMLRTQEQAGDAAAKSGEKVTKSNRSWIASNKDLHKFYLESKKSASEAGEAGVKAGHGAATAQGVANAAMRAGVDHLGHMALGWFSLHKAIDVAKESFVGYAKMDDKLRLFRSGLGLTHHQMEEIEEVVSRTARSVAEDTGEMTDAFKIMADTAGLTVEQIAKIYPQVALMAKGAGIKPGEMARMISDSMRVLNIVPEKAGEAMEIMWGAMSKLNVNIGMLAPHMNEITTEMSELGYTGLDALTEIGAVMGTLNNSTKNTTESAELLQRMLQGIPTEYSNLGYASKESLIRTLKASDSPLATLIELYRTAKNQEEVMANTPTRLRRGIRKMLQDDNAGIVGDNKKLLEQLGKGNAGEKAAQERLEGPMQQLNKLKVTMDQTAEQFGALMNAFGATWALKLVVKQFDDLRRNLKTITELLNSITSGKILDPKTWHGKGINAAPWKPRYSKEEIEEMKKKGFWRFLFNMDAAKPDDEHGADDTHAAPQDHGAGTDDHGMPPPPPGVHRQSYRGGSPNDFRMLAQNVRYLTSEVTGGGGATRNRETYGTSTDAKYLNASYMPSGGYPGQGTGAGVGPGYGVGGGLGTRPEDMAPAGPPGARGTGYDGGTTLAPPGTGNRGQRGERVDGQTPAAGTSEEPAPTTTTTGQPVGGGGTVAADQGAATPRSAQGRIAMAKQAMIDEAIKQGVDPARAVEAANLMAGQALSESELNPTLSHDQGTGHGIYGARLGRRQAMFDWLAKHGYDKNSLAGQSRYMMQEALSKDSRGRYKFPKTAAALKSADPATRAEAVRTLTKEFEAPADQGPGQMQRRLGRTQQAAGVAPGGLPTQAPAPTEGIPTPGGLPAQAGTSAPVLPPELRPPAGAMTPPEPGVAGAAGGPETPGVATGDRLLPGRDLRGTDPRIKEIVTAAAEALPPGYKIAPTSGVRTAGQGQHTHGRAVDWQIIGPDNKPIANRGDDKTGLYTKLAQAAYGYQEKYHPQLTGKFQWGGQFGTSSRNPNEPDLMHFDTGGRRGRITRYSREKIGTILPPRPGDRPVTPPPPATAAAPPARPTETPPVQPTDDGGNRTTPPEARAPANEMIQSQNRDINMNVNVNSAQVQFARNTIDRQVYASMDRSRANSYHDISTA
jgi:minor tail protein/tail lysozyme